MNKRVLENNVPVIIDEKKRKVIDEVRSGVVVVEHNGHKSFVSECYSSYPLRLIQQQSWLSCVSFSMLGFGGGMVAGDEIKMKVDVKTGGVVCFKTQGTNKVFKSTDGAETLQRFEATVANQGLLALTPDPTTCYENAVFCQQQSFNVAEGGSLVLVDWFTSGRNCSSEYWKATRIRNEIAVKYNDKLVFVENQDIQSSSFGSLSQKLGNSEVVGMIILVGPRTAELRKSLDCFKRRQTFREKRVELTSLQANGGAVANLEDIPLVSVSTISSDATIVRFMLPDLQYGYEFVMEMLRPLSVDLGGLIPY